jgi:hypothetical protein
MQDEPPDEPVYERARQVPVQVRVQIPGVQRHAHHAVGAVKLGVLDGVQVVPGLADGILLHGGLVVVIIQIVERHAPLWRVQVARRGRDPHDTHSPFRFCLGRRRQERRQELREHEGADVVDAELELVPLRRLGALRRDHDAGIVDEEVEFGFFREEVLRGGLDRGEVGEVETEEFQRSGRLWKGGLDGLDCFPCLVFGPCGDVDLGVFAVENLGEFFANAGVGSGYDVDLEHIR